MIKDTSSTCNLVRHPLIFDNTVECIIERYIFISIVLVSSGILRKVH